MQPRTIPSNPSQVDNTMMVDNEMSSPPNGHAHAQGVVSPLIGSGLTFSKITENLQPIRPSTPPIPIRFATTTNAFGLSPSTSTTTSSSSPSTNTNPLGMRVDISPPSAGSITTRKLRRPSMLSLQQNFSFGSDNSGGKADDEATPMGETNMNLNMVQDPSSSKTINNNNAPAPAPFNSNTLQPTPRWAGHGGSFASAMIRRTSSAPIIPFEDLKTSTPPITATPHLPDDSGMMMDMEDEIIPSEERDGEQSSLKWMPSHLKSQSSSNLRKGKGKMEDSQNGMDLLSPAHTPMSARAQGFTGKPLPNALLKTLASEERPLDQEIESEAKLQKFLLSHPTKLPLTPKTSASGNTKYRNSRGRFPDQVGGDDDELEDDSLFSTALANRRSTSWTTTLSRRSRNWMDRARFDDDTDTESDEEEEDEEVLTNTSNPNNNKGKEEPVNSAFAAGMDMDRPGSSSSSSVNMWTGTGSISNSGKSTPPHQPPLASVSMGNPFPTPPSTNNSFPPNFTNTNRSARLSFSQTQSQGMVPSPGYGLPSAFGGLGMGGNGLGTPLGSPTVERAELGASPSASGTMGVGSPGLMLYRESQGGQATVRPGKRKAQAEDRFDPYKRPRGSSPSLMNSSPFPISPSRTNAIPIPQSPSHAPLYPSSLSSLSASHPRHTQHGRPTHPYTRPMTSRSRAASPALSIGSTNGNGLSSSLGNKGYTLNGNGNGGQQQQQQLGGLGLLSLQNSRVDEEDEREGGEEMSRVDSEEKMEED